jgi:LPS-assembly protein
MPCYGCQLKPRSLFRPIPLSNINRVPCHGKILRSLCILILLFVKVASPQLGSISTPQLKLPAPPPPQDAPTVERPDFSVKVVRTNAPADASEYPMTADAQEYADGIMHLHGHVVVELVNATFRADEAEYDEDTKMFKAHGSVSYRNYDHNEVIYCDSMEYNEVTKHGTFHHVRGYAKTKVVARPGVLTTQEPFYFEGVTADKFEDRYILYDGMITDCKIPNPWWTLRSKKFDIVPDESAKSRSGVFRLHRIPIFYFPYFYKSLKKEPRKSGFTTPEAGHSSQFGYFFGLGYYWAISRTMDATYLLQDYTARGLAHHLNFRGKPTQKSDFNFILYGVQDSGVTSNGVTTKAPGVSITGTAKTEFGNGWYARASIDYLSSFLFRQTFSNSFNEAIYTSTISSAFVTKKFDYYTFNTSVSRTENFQSTIANDSITIRKLPEFEFESRDHELFGGPVPLYVSFDSTFGLFHRVQPSAEPGFYETRQFTPRGNFQPTLTTALHWKGINVVPTFTMHETYYGQSFVNGAVSTAALTRNAPELGLDIILPPVERIYNRKTFLGDKLKHVIEPRLKYKYVSGVDNFANTLRFDTLDLLSSTNELEIGITNRLYAKRGDTVNEVFTWELYQKRYFDPTFGGAVIPGQRNVVLAGIDLTGYSFLDGPRNYSPIVSIFRGSPRPGIGLQWQADYDPLRKAIVNSTFSADIRYKRYLTSIGSNFVKPDPIISPPANQLRAQFGYGDPNRRGWNYAVSGVYDYKLGFLEFATSQVTYNTDCCGFSIEYARNHYGLRDDSVYRVAFSIANFGTFGNLKKQERLF